MPKQHFNTAFDQLREEVLSYYNEPPENYVPVVSEERQQQELNLLKDTVHHERFFFSVNMFTFEIEHSAGIDKWLGYGENDFTLKKYWNHIVHEGNKKALLLVSNVMYKLLGTGFYPLEFVVQRFTGVIALKHYEGHYIVARKASSVFQYDQKNRLLSYIDEFTIINNNVEEEELTSQSFAARITNVRGINETDKEDEILSLVTKSFNKLKVFTEQEFQLLRQIAYTPGITRAVLAGKFNITVNTISTVYSRLLTKAKQFFDKDFATVESVSRYMKNEGLL